MGTIVFNNKPTVTKGEPYYWGDIKIGVQYNIINSYEKIFDGTSRHFFLIQESMNSAAPLIEVPLDNNFTYSNFTTGQVLNS
jgi:hypothetical protein